MYSTRTGLILGFHGCDQSIIQDILTGKKTLEPSTNEYDWLGHGVYFWDNSPARAMEFATFLQNNPGKARRPISKPAVLGAIINLGYCLDLLDYYAILIASKVIFCLKKRITDSLKSEINLLARGLALALVGAGADGWGLGG